MKLARRTWLGVVASLFTAATLILTPRRSWSNQPRKGTVRGRVSTDGKSLAGILVKAMCQDGAVCQSPNPTGVDGAYNLEVDATHSYRLLFHEQATGHPLVVVENLTEGATQSINVTVPSQSTFWRLYCKLHVIESTVAFAVANTASGKLLGEPIALDLIESLKSCRSQVREIKVSDGQHKLLDAKLTSVSAAMAYLEGSKNRAP